MQYVTSSGLSKYVTKYVTKAELKSIVSSLPNNDPGVENNIQMHIQGRRIGVMEIMCLLNSKPIIKLSSSVEFLTNTPLELRTLTIRRVHEIE